MSKEEPYVVAPGAKLPIALLSQRERQELASVVSKPSATNVKRTDRGHFVSQFGESKRVLWESRVGEPARILSILDKSYTHSS